MTLYRYTQYYYIPERKQQPKKDEDFSWVGFVVGLIVIVLIIKGILS